MKKKIFRIVFATVCLLLSSCGITSKTDISDDSSSSVTATISSSGNAASTSLDTEVSIGTYDKNNEVEQSKSNSHDISTPEEGFKINNDILSELGMTYLQLTEKHGNPSGIYNAYSFEDGYGRYGWKSYEGKIFEDMETAGGCIMIGGVDVEELFSGLSYPISFNELADQYDFVIISVESEVGMDECYWAELTHPLYDNISFIFATTEYGSMNANTSCCVMMNVDCLKASPILFKQEN